MIWKSFSKIETDASVIKFLISLNLEAAKQAIPPPLLCPIYEYFCSLMKVYQT